MSTVTSLPISPEMERSHRMKVYSLYMLIRMICIGLCFVVPGWFIVLPILGAVLIPYLAVVLANSKTKGSSDVESPHKLLVKI